MSITATKSIRDTVPGKHVEEDILIYILKRADRYLRGNQEPIGNHIDCMFNSNDKFDGILVKNVPDALTASSLVILFSAFGPVKNARKIDGQAFLIFHVQEHAKKALRLDGCSFYSSQLRVSLSKVSLVREVKSPFQNCIPYALDFIYR